MIIKGFNINMNGKRTINGRKLTNENLTEMGNDVMMKYQVIYEHYMEDGEVSVIPSKLFNTYEEVEEMLLRVGYEKDGFDENEFFVLENYDYDGNMISYYTANIHAIEVEL